MVACSWNFQSSPGLSRMMPATSRPMLPVIAESAVTSIFAAVTAFAAILSAPSWPIRALRIFTTPPLASALAARASGALQDPSAPRVVQRGAELTVTPGDDTRARAFAIYDRSGASPALAELVPARASGGTDVTLGTGHWAISVVDRHGLESRAVVVVVP